MSILTSDKNQWQKSNIHRTTSFHQLPYQSSLRFHDSNIYLLLIGNSCLKSPQCLPIYPLNDTTLKLTVKDSLAHLDSVFLVCISFPWLSRRSAPLLKLFTDLFFTTMVLPWVSSSLCSCITHFLQPPSSSSSPSQSHEPTTPLFFSRLFWGHSPHSLYSFFWVHFQAWR